MTTNLIQIKQDLNFWEMPLWFQNVRHQNLGFLWQDIEGYEYRSGYKPPDKTDILVLLYLLHKSQENNYEPIVECSRYEILKACELPINSQYYNRLRDSIKRWSSIAIHFEGTFYDGKNYMSINFHIMKGKVEKREVKVVLDSDWLSKIKMSKYFRRVNFGKYKALKRPVSRRLYEILLKNFLARNKWSIRLIKLGKKLTLTGDETKNEKKTKRVIYASKVLEKIKPAINEINKLSTDPDIISKTGIKPKDLFTLTYTITGEKQDRVIIFEKNAVEIKTETNETAQSNSSKINSLLELLKHKSKKLKKAITNYFQQKDFDYVKWNILYANKNAKKNYSHYLQQALENNWAEEWAEEEKIKAEKESLQKLEKQRKLEEQKRQQELERLAEEQRPLFCQAAAALDENIKEQFWIQADKETPKDTFRREFNVKIRYAELIFNELNEQGMNFIKEIFSHLGIVSDIALIR